ncbi:UNVERIFIED_CONTAM: hypothetical protein K2H54_027887 [Gekko kuhli]
MAPCGRVRAGSRGPGPFLILLLLAFGPARAEQGAGAVAGGGFPGVPLQPQQAVVLGAQQPPQPVLAGAAPGGGVGRPPRAGASSGGGWKLADEPACREDVTRVCPKHSWANNLAVLECLQDVREERCWEREAMFLKKPTVLPDVFRLEVIAACSAASSILFPTLLNAKAGIPISTPF